MHGHCGAHVSPVFSHMHRDVLDTTLNYSAHVKFVSKWLDKLEAEEKKAAEASAAPAATTETTAPAEGTGAAPAETPSADELGRAAQAVQA